MYLEETNPLLLNHLTLADRLHSYLTLLDEQAKECCQMLIQQMVEAEDVSENLK
jgi:hypothetical protein